MFIFNAKINRSIYYLIGFLIPLAIYGIFHHLVFFNESALKLAIINVQSLPLYYLPGPMIYFYVRSTLKDDHRLSKIDFLHFIPAIIGLVSVLPYIFQSFDYKLNIAQQFIDEPNRIKTIRTHWFYPNYINVLVRPIQLFGYSLVCLLFIWKYSKKKRSYSPTAQKNTLTKWLLSISIIALLISICYLFMTYKFFITKNLNKEIFNQLPISLITGFAYAIIPVMMIIFPDILYGIPRNQTENSLEEEVKEEKNLRKARADKKEVKVNENALKELMDFKITTDPFAEIAQRIITYIEENKAYLDPNFSINDLVENLKIQKHHAHYCFKTIINAKFIDVKNNYRVAHAKNLLVSEKINKMTIEGIGLESGFSSKSHFFAIFKAKTGLSPLDYMQSIAHVQDNSVNEHKE
jgi:AraC-like DNA-binding protein